MRSIHVFAAIVIIFAAHLTAFSQNASISGKIVEFDTQKGVPFATINVDAYHGSYSSDDGTFIIENLDAGNYNLTLSCIGFEKLENISVAVAEGQALNVGNIEMTLQSVQINEIVITEQVKIFDSKYNGSNTVISAKTLQRIQPLGTEEMIRMVPGVNIAGDMGISNRPNISIRGSDPRRSNKILLLEDGSPISPAPYLAPGAYYNPPADRLDGIQVIKGPDVLIYGANNIFGVVNYITKRPPVKPTASVKLTGGQRGYFSAIGSYGGTWKNTGAELQAIYKRFDGYTDNSDLSIFNIAGKWFSQLTENQSIYLKLNFQSEYVNNSLSGITPFTFETDPERNPFDADEFTSHRYGVDFIYNVNPTNALQLQTKFYGSDFYRDWWKQNSKIIPASEVANYVSAESYANNYSYLDNLEFGPDDYVRVGKVTNGIESNSDSRWQYYVYGIHEKATYKWNTNVLEGAIKLHGETYHDIVIRNDSSRWARSGYTSSDVLYNILAPSAYVRNEFRFGRFSLIPIVRYEYIMLQQNDVLANGNDPNNTGGDFGVIKNNFGEFTPGLSFIYRDLKWLKTRWELYGGVYRGFSSPTTAIGFNEVMDGEVVIATESADLKPEYSFNQEIGVRFDQPAGGVNGQASVFNMLIDNFYSPARSQAFQTLGSVRISGIELALSNNFANLFNSTRQGLQAGISVTLMQSQITGGTLTDKDLVTTITHSAATKEELINKINSDRDAFEVYLNDELYTGTVDITQFDQITSVAIIYGENFIADYDVPYVPQLLFNADINYWYHNFNIGITFHYVGEQYTEFFNFTNESADGAIGKLPAYNTLDVNLGYDFELQQFRSVTLFLVGKNITNQIYRSSRLNRATGGIFPAGFMQWNIGVSCKF